MKRPHNYSLRLAMLRAAEPDFEVNYFGSITLLTPRTDAAHGWAVDHLPCDCMMIGPSYAIESRYADDIMVGIIGDGLVV